MQMRLESWNDKLVGIAEKKERNGMLSELIDKTDY